MFSLSDLKQTRVYQEALEEGRQEGRMESRQEGRQEGRMEEKIETVRRMVALGFNAEQIAAGTGLTIEEVRGIIASGQGNGDT